jgi:hypothetical protein
LNEDTAALRKVQVKLAQQPKTFDGEMFEYYHTFLSAD